jgi:hypothetical protein
MEEDDYFGEEFEEDIYSAKEAEELLDEDALSLKEEAFMIGYDEEMEGKAGKVICRFCKYELDTEDRICPACGASITNAVEA